MNSSRKTAIIVGGLYIIGTVAGVLSVVFTTSILNDPEYLIQISANEKQIIAGALFVLLMGFSLAMVPVLLFPILKKQHEALALGYIVFRGALETVTYIALVICWLFLMVLSREYVAAGAPADSYFQTLGALLRGGYASINTILIIVFSLGALMLYGMFYQSRLIPRWISVWGFIAIILHFTTAFLLIFHIVDSDTAPVLLVMNFPIFLQEMVMAVWLIAKGFNSPENVSMPVKNVTIEA